MNEELACLSLPVTAEHLNHLYTMLTINEPGLAQRCRPGNFFELRAPLVSARKLYKPISVYKADDTKISFLVKRVGPGTEALCALSDGDPLELFGPLGNEFPTLTDSNILLISGGIGYPPLAYLREALDDSNTIFSLHGASTEADRFPADEIWQMKGPAERQGLVTEGMLRYLEKNQVDVVYACGPLPMLKTVAEICAGREIRAYVSMEAYMACGIGACHGCAVPVGSAEAPEYLRVCKEGPVFDSASIVWELL